MSRLRSFAALIDRFNGHVVVACDTEFKGPHTLTIQFAARLGDEILVQVYSSPDVLSLSDPESVVALIPPELNPSCSRVVVREGRPITPDLSPREGYRRPLRTRGGGDDAPRRLRRNQERRAYRTLRP